MVSRFCECQEPIEPQFQAKSSDFSESSASPAKKKKPERAIPQWGTTGSDKMPEATERVQDQRVGKKIEYTD